MKQSALSHLFFLLNLVTLGICWQFFASLIDYSINKSSPYLNVSENVSSEYNFGDCRRKDKMLYKTIHLDHKEVSGKVIVRGWLNITKVPTCIIVRGMAYESDWFRSTSHSFLMCVPRITYCYKLKRYHYYYYEWYIQPYLVGNMDWDLYFFGPNSADWV